MESGELGGPGVGGFEACVMVGGRCLEAWKLSSCCATS